jgi:RHS repeat-associated protein
VTERTRYVWNEDWLIQEVTTRLEGETSARVRQRDYCYGAGRAVMAHADVAFDSQGTPTTRKWYFYVSDPFGFPERLVDAQGNIAATLVRSAFGEVTYAPGSTTATPVRKLGQYCDDETGLCYNRWRSYDPEAGRFISPDPLGLEGGLNVYGLGVNPIRWDDPLGLSTDLSDRTGALRDQMPNKQACMAIAQLSDGSTVATMNRNGQTPPLGRAKRPVPRRSDPSSGRAFGHHGAGIPADHGEGRWRASMQPRGTARNPCRTEGEVEDRLDQRDEQLLR